MANAADGGFIPSNEDERLAAVRRYDILDTPPDGAFDRITQLAARLFDVPISIVSIVDRDRIWFKSRYGVDAKQTGRDPGLCASAILRDERLLLTDASKNLHALANPLVTGKFGLRFYLGVPLRTHDGFNLGTLCVIDRVPRTPAGGMREHLQDLASLVMDQMELRRSANELIRGKNMLLREINHRVSNSLHLVSSLLQMQARRQPEAVQSELNHAAGRVEAVARVYRRLYHGDEVTVVEFKQYLEELCAEMTESLAGRRNVRIVVDAEPATLLTGQCTHLGLILNELVTNSVKHAFPPDTPGNIRVRFRSRRNYLELKVADDGCGLPRGFDPAAGNGFGSQLIRSFTHQLSGKLSCGPGPGGRGTEITLRFR